jgi:uncharacterized membrane protein YebE (DUF533 family)
VLVVLVVLVLEQEALEEQALLGRMLLQQEAREVGAGLALLGGLAELALLAARAAKIYRAEQPLTLLETPLWEMVVALSWAQVAKQQIPQAALEVLVAVMEAEVGVATVLAQPQVQVRQVRQVL